MGNGIQISQYYDNDSVMIEQNLKGFAKLSIHIYSEDIESITEQAVKVFLDTKQKLLQKGIKLLRLADSKRITKLPLAIFRLSNPMVSVIRLKVLYKVAFRKISITKLDFLAVIRPLNMAFLLKNVIIYMSILAMIFIALYLTFSLLILYFILILLL
jgi:hypothetical protein